MDNIIYATNTGHLNTGDYNSGDSNTGSCNTGDCNTGYLNTGDYNTGHLNTGSCNTGYRNTGDYNSGNRNTGDWNSTSFSSGHFCTETHYFMFNKPCTIEDFFCDKPNWLYFKLTQWVESSEMSDQEKSEHPTYKTTGGFLKVYDYKQAAQKAWHEASKEEKEDTLKLPNFDADIFFQIFGIDVRKNNEVQQRIANLEQELKELKKLI